VRILITADPYIPIPPRLYGGIERILDFLVRGLVNRGHTITLIAHPDSQAPAELVPYGRPPHFGFVPRATELAQVASALWRRRGSVDVVHSFGRLAALLPILPLRRLPKVQSYQRDIPWTSVARAVRLAGQSMAFTGCSASVYRERPHDRDTGRWLTIPNGVDVAGFTCTASVAPDAPLMFLGRLEPIKGAHHAIAIARAANRRLIIAGNKVPEYTTYFDEQIAPHLDGTRVTYVGTVNDAQKNTWLGAAAAFLMPIDWEEPFGIVMAEAMACGTPVIAFKRGSVTDIVRDGVNGFACATVEEAAAAVGRLHTIDRRRVREDCEARFDASVIITQYEQLYEETIRSSR
jgi:glycosyltransferase involved in cell wall biosynthesis